MGPRVKSLDGFPNHHLHSHCRVGESSLPPAALTPGAGPGLLLSFQRLFPVWLLGALGMAGKALPLFAASPPPSHQLEGRVQENSAPPTNPLISQVTFGGGALQESASEELEEKGLTQKFKGDRVWSC